MVEVNTSDGVSPITIGVVTHARRTVAFAKLLKFLAPAIRHYGGEVELLVTNNSGESHGDAVRQEVANSGIADVCSWRVVDSPENNITVGRNLLMENASHRLMAVVDDDEYPIESWLSALVSGHQQLASPIVGGPIEPIYQPGVAHWIRQIDVHNGRGLKTGDKVDFIASGNFLIDLEAAGKTRFDPGFGKTGGGDTEFFLRLKDAGITIRWVEEALVEEDIPLEKSTVRYVIRRSMSQGSNYRRIMQARGEISSVALFVLKAALVFLGSLCLALVLILFRHQRAGDWMKRAFSNLGKLWQPDRPLYQ
ncbi:MAG: glycosyltransferase [Granulosicoccus sp.]